MFIDINNGLSSWIVIKIAFRIIRKDRRFFSIAIDYPWSFFVLVRTHNPEVIGSSPIPVTSKTA